MDIDLVLSGSGMLFPCHLGAYAYLTEQGVTVRRVAGASGGAAVAAIIAHGWDVDDAMALSREITTKPVLDTNWMPWNGVGLFKGDHVLSIIKKHLPGKMSDANIPWGAFTSDVWKRQGLFVSSGHLESSVPIMLGMDLATADVIRASISIPFWFKMAMLKKRPQVDGGLKINFGMGVWDDEPSRPTIGIRFKSSTGDEKRTRGLIENASAILSMLIDNSNDTYVSKKRWPYVIEVASEGNGMDFSVDTDWILARFAEGWAAAEVQWPLIKEVCNGT